MAFALAYTGHGAHHEARSSERVIFHSTFQTSDSTGSGSQRNF